LNAVEALSTNSPVHRRWVFYTKETTVLSESPVLSLENAAHPRNRCIRPIARCKPVAALALSALLSLPDKAGAYCQITVAPRDQPLIDAPTCWSVKKNVCKRYTDIWVLTSQEVIK
jgi:hypothetical protein